MTAWVMPSRLDGWIAAWDGQIGHISGSTGQGHAFRAIDWRSDQTPEVGMRVRYRLHLGVATNIMPADDLQKSDENTETDSQANEAETRFGKVTLWDRESGEVTVNGVGTFEFSREDWPGFGKPSLGQWVMFRARGKRAEKVHSVNCLVTGAVVIIAVLVAFGIWGPEIDNQPGDTDNRPRVETNQATRTAQKNLDTPNDRCAHWWDGSHAGLGRVIEDYLIDPDHQSTFFGGFDVYGTQYVFARYRTETIFGGYADWRVTAEGTVDCEVISIEVE